MNIVMHTMLIASHRRQRAKSIRSYHAYMGQGGHPRKFMVFELHAFPLWTLELGSLDTPPDPSATCRENDGPVLTNIHVLYSHVRLSERPDLLR